MVELHGPLRVLAEAREAYDMSVESTLSALAAGLATDEGVSPEFIQDAANTLKTAHIALYRRLNAVSGVVTTAIAGLEAPATPSAPSLPFTETVQTVAEHLLLAGTSDTAEQLLTHVTNQVDTAAFHKIAAIEEAALLHNHTSLGELGAGDYTASMDILSCVISDCGFEESLTACADKSQQIEDCRAAIEPGLPMKADHIAGLLTRSLLVESRELGVAYVPQEALERLPSADEDPWTDLADRMKYDELSSAGLPSLAALPSLWHAGARALPAAVAAAGGRSLSDFLRAPLDTALPVSADDVGRSVLVCPVSLTPCETDNVEGAGAPLRLRCGHVIGSKSFQLLRRSSQGGYGSSAPSVRCVYCSTPTLVTETLTLKLS